MEKPISVGDLVQVVRTCCVPHLGGVTVMRIAEIHRTALQGRKPWCSACCADLPRELYASSVSGKWGLPVSWLKRIPPLDELESVRTEETLKETA